MAVHVLQRKGRCLTSVMDLNGASQNFDCTLDPQEKDLLKDGFEITELAASPVSQTPCLQLKPPDQIPHCTDTVARPDLAQRATQARKQRALDKSREAQKRFRVRQKARLDDVQAQLDLTTKQLRELHVQQQQLQTRNVLLEKIAQLSKEQTSEEYLVWQNKQAVLDFGCAHTQQSSEGFTLILTIFGHAEKRECRTVSDMSVRELAALWSEYMRKLGKCLLALQHDHQGSARPLLDLWVAEAIALICCVRVYNPEFLKVIDSSAMDGSKNTRLSKPALEQHMELLELSPDQVQDGLYIRRIAAARAAELQAQRREASALVMPTSSSSGRQHPSDHLASAHAVAEKMKIIGAEEYKLHGIVMDALFNGVMTSMQGAMGLVHMYPFLPDAMEYLDCIASLQGAPSAPQKAVTLADWDALLAYCAKVTAADHFHYVPLLRSTHPSGQATAAATAVTPTHLGVAPSQTQSPVQKSVHFSSSSVLGQPPYPVSSSQARSYSGQVSSSIGRSYSGSYSVEHMTSAYSHSPPHNPLNNPPHNPRLQSDASQALPSPGMSQMVQSVEGTGPMSRQGSDRLTMNHTTEAPAGWVPQSQASQHLSLPARQNDAPHHSYACSQHQTSGVLHAAQPFSAQGMALHGHTHGTKQAAPTTANSFQPLQLQQAQFVQLEGVQALHPSAPIQGFVGQGMIDQGRVIQGQGPDHPPAWLGQNLAYMHGSPVVQSGSQAQVYSPMQMQPASQFAQSPDPKAMYPTAAMRSQQLTAVQTHQAQPAGSVQAPLAPFLNEQLKRVLAEGGPSGRRGF